jgi:WD40 repeat protein
VLTAGQRDATVRQWDVPAGTKRSSAKVTQPDLGANAETFSVVRFPDGNLLAVKFMIRVVIWDAANEKPVAKIEQNYTYWNGSGDVVLSPDGKTLAVPWVDKDVVLWDLATRKERRLTGHSGNVVAVAFSPDGKTIASASADQTVLLWDVAKGEPIDEGKLRGHNQTVWLVQFSADGKTLATCASEREPFNYGAPGHGTGNSVVKLWDVERRKEIPVGQGLKEVSTFRLAPDGKTIAVSAWDEAVKQWKVRLVDVATGEDRAAFKNEHGAALGMTLSADGVLAWGHRDGTVGLWEVGLKAPGR